MNGYDEPMTARIPVVRVNPEPQPPRPVPPAAEIPVHNHPKPQRHLEAPKQTVQGDTTYIETGEGYFDEIDGFAFPPGTNLLPTVYTNVFDGFGTEIPNTLPSSPLNPDNLHDGPVERTAIDGTSPSDDPPTVVFEVRSRAARAGCSVLLSVQGTRLVVVAGGADDEQARDGALLDTLAGRAAGSPVLAVELVQRGSTAAPPAGS